MDRGQVPTYDGTRPDGSLGPNSASERDRVRRYLANRVRREIPQRWDDSVAELTDLIDMLALWPKWDDAAEKSVRRASVRDCSPVSESIQTRRARKQQGNRQVG